MVLLDQDKFLTELGRLFDKSKAKGAVTITLKRSTLVNKRSKKYSAEAEAHCLVRAVSSERKLSTVVQGPKQARFADSYGTILKAHMDNLKKKEKLKPKKAGGAK